MSRVLFVSANGILEPLGHSQIVRVVEALSRRGLKYDILSQERDADLTRTEHVQRLEAQLALAGVRWYRCRYEPGGPKAAARNTWVLTKATLERTRSGEYELVHARAFLAGVPARIARLATGVPYLYDARAYWLDEKLDDGRWFPAGQGSPAERLARRIERQVFADAAGIVTLTELQAQDIRAGTLGPPGGRPLACIPTCADFDMFALPGARTAGARPEWTHVPISVRERLQGGPVIGFIGSINRSYFSEESASLAARLLRRWPNAMILATSPQVKEYHELFARHDIPPDRAVVGRVEHWAMPEWLSLVSWGMLLIDPTPAKRASVPTKLAEFFAAGVRPIQYGCNSEISEWVARAGTGVVLEGVDARTLDDAADRIAATPDEAGALERGRSIAEPHFSLASGVERYARILKALGQ
ncbi:MAG: hypothetical protein EXR69_14335 [Myxococcales bacterium]|nr:hypothetical protein [Myxococcales bacterium]